MRILLSFCALVVVLCLGSDCYAETITFSFVPTTGAAAETVSFTVPPVPDSYAVGYYSTYESNGATQFRTSSDLYIFYEDFYKPSAYLTGQDFDFAYTYYLSPGNPVSGIYGFTGVQLYTGSEASPTFVPGTYTLTYQPLNSAGFTDAADNSTISLTIAATPEPSPLLLLGTGAVGIVAIARRRLAAAAGDLS